MGILFFTSFIFSMKKTILYSFGLLCILSNCKKRTDPIPDTRSYEVNDPDKVTCLENKDYYPLSKGSYWIYENSFFNSSINFRFTRSYDSTYILQKDTIIEGRVFFLIATTTTLTAPLSSTYTSQGPMKYSGDFVVNDSGYKHFSACMINQVIQTIEDVNWTSELRVLDGDTLYTVPAGNFEARIEENKYTVPAYENDLLGKYRYEYIFYAKNVGQIYHAIPYFAAPEMLEERRLVRYHIE